MAIIVRVQRAERAVVGASGGNGLGKGGRHVDYLGIQTVGMEGENGNAGRTVIRHSELEIITCSAP
jgi:hypothetical protein